MTFSAYIQRQKTLIRERHEGDLYLLDGNDEIKLQEDNAVDNLRVDNGKKLPVDDKRSAPAVEKRVRSTDEILLEMENLVGLNKPERAAFGTVIIRR
jgi:hypothetical protein